MLANDLGKLSIWAKYAAGDQTLSWPPLSPQRVSINIERMNQHFFREVGEISPLDRVVVRTKCNNVCKQAHCRCSVNAGAHATPSWPPTRPLPPCSPTVRQLRWRYKWFSFVSEFSQMVWNMWLSSSSSFPFGFLWIDSATGEGQEINN